MLNTFNDEGEELSPHSSDISLGNLIRASVGDWNLEVKKKKIEPVVIVKIRGLGNLLKLYYPRSSLVEPTRGCVLPNRHPRTVFESPEIELNL